MPFVAIYKAERAKGWRAPAGASAALKDTYAVAGRNVRQFSGAFTSAVRALLTPKILAALEAKIKAGATVEQIVATIPWYDPAKPETLDTWEPIETRLVDAYTKTMGEAKATANDAIDRALGLDEEPSIGLESVEKKERKSKRGGGDKKKPPKRVQRIATVPVNPASIDWAKQQSARLVREVSAQTKATIRSIVAESIARGERAEAMVSAIKRNVGLLERERAAVDRRRALMLSRGVSETRTEDLADRYARQLLNARATRIARTETISAQNQGVLDGWQEADRAGQLPAVERVWDSAPESANPTRPCPICLELNGKTTGLNEPFYSSILGKDIMAPPSHPHCRCAQLLRRKGEKE